MYRFAAEQVQANDAGARPDWRLIALLTSVAALNYCDRTALSAVLPLIRADLHVSDVWLGALGSAFLWAYALGSPLAGWLADRTSRAVIVILSLTAWSIVTLATGLVRDANQLLFTRVLLGLAECAYLPAAVGLLADRHQPQTRGTAMGFHTAGLSFGTIAGATLAGYLGERFGWRSTFLLLGGLGVVMAIMSAFQLRGKDVPVVQSEIRDESGSVRELFAVPSYWILLAQSMVVSIGIWLFMNWLPLYFKETFGMGLAAAGFSGTALLQAPGIAGVVLGGYASDAIARRDSSKRMLLQSTCYFVGGPLLLSFVGKPALAIVCAAVFGFSLLRSVAVANENPLLCDLLAPRLRSTAIAWMNTANCLAGGIGVFAAGYFKQDYGLDAVFAAISGIVVVAALITMVGYRFLLRADLRRTARD
jgi:predicted MFS family arabinose efflux permease